MTAAVKQDSSIYKTLEEVCATVPGWSPAEELFALFTLAVGRSQEKGDFLEIGSWCGRSMVALGLAAKETQERKVYCIDPFPEKDDWVQNSDGTYSMRAGEVSAYQEQKVWKEPFERDIAPLYNDGNSPYTIFMAQRKKYGLEEVVIPFRGTVEQFTAQKDATSLSLQLAFIDGDHDYNSLKKDIAFCKQKLHTGGWLCFDDAFTSYEAVDRAIKERVIADNAFGEGTQLTRKLFVTQKAG